MGPEVLRGQHLSLLKRFEENRRKEDGWLMGRMVESMAEGLGSRTTCGTRKSLRVPEED